MQLCDLNSSKNGTIPLSVKQRKHTASLWSKLYSLSFFQQQKKILHSDLCFHGKSPFLMKKQRFPYKMFTAATVCE
jgi:hypothetical protein